MTHDTLLGAAAALLAASLVGCADEVTLAGAPPPAALDRDAVGYYCGMTVADHAGPKAQIHLRGQAQPYWFVSVRDAIAFTRLPEEPKNIAAVYVNDMGPGTWEQPDAGAWVEAHDAWFVVGSAMVGGMGAPETVPFSTPDAANTFVQANGGSVMRLAEVPEDAVLGPVPATSATHATNATREKPATHETSATHETNATKTVLR